MFRAVGLSREPWGMVQVVMRFTSSIASVATTEIEEGTMSPWKLALAM